MPVNLTHTHKRTHKPHAHTHTHTYVHTYTHTQRHTHTHAHTNHMLTHTHTHICTHINTHICTNTHHIYAHAHKPSGELFSLCITGTISASFPSFYLSVCLSLSLCLSQDRKSTRLD